MTGCQKVRDRLLDASRLPEVRDHLRSCPACARFAGRAEAVRRGLREHHAGVEPDPGFATRVAGRVRRQPAELLGWAAVRLLPATLAVVLVLGWFASRVTVETTTVVASNGQTMTDDVLTWVFEETEVE